MSNNVIRSIGEKIVEKTVVVHVHEAEVVALGEGEYALVVGDKEVANAEEHSLKKWLVNPDAVDGTNGFYVTNREEAVDALEDLALLILAVRKGEL
ncbi:hypothetical protein [Mycobacteroides salmoniphilum]|uniref:hypothetical protein n=1 Tax=Mycobacteroides salmoniphilum TaxID=404941 RepID=UPI000991CDF4|nr:hypothetical protein [Mycobacteroides salmoniphilum]